MNLLRSFFIICLFAITLNVTFSQDKLPIETILQKGHSRYVSCLAYSPDGNYIVTGSYDNTLILWNAENGKQIRVFAQHTGFIRSVEFSPSGNQILTTSGDNRALVYDILTGKTILELKQDKGRLWGASYSPDGLKIITMDDRTETRIWNAKNGESVKILKKNYTSATSPKWFSPDGTWTMSYIDSKKSSIIHFVDSSLNKSLEIEKSVSYAVSPDGKLIAIGNDKMQVGIFNATSGERLHFLNTSEDQQCDGCRALVDFSPNSKLLVTAAKYSGIIIWDANKGKKLVHISTEEDTPDDLSFSPKGTYVMATFDDQSFVWETKIGELVLAIDNDGLECTPVFSPDDRFLLTNNKQNTAALWNIRQKKRIRVFEGFLNKEKDDGLKFSQSNWYHSNIIRYIQLKSHASVSPDGKYLAKGNIDSSAFLLDLQTGKILHWLKGHSKAVLCTEFSPNGKTLATAGGDGKVIFWNVQTGEKIKTLQAHHELIFDIDFSSDGKTLVTSSWDGTFRIWDLKTDKLLQYVKIEDASPFTAQFIPNDLYVALGTLDKKLSLWEVDAAKQFREIIGHTDIVSSISFSPDGRNMATASLDGKAKVWDLLSGMQISKFGKHTSGVYSIDFDPLNRFIATGSNDKTIQLWDPLNEKIVHTLTGHSGGVTSVQFTSNGKKLISCSIDGDIKTWNIETCQEIFTYIQIDHENWLAKNPQGYFDGSPKALKLINYVSGLEVISIGALFEKYYSPNLIARIQAGEEFEDIAGNIQQLMQNTPKLSFNVLSDQLANSTHNTDSIEWFKSTITLNTEITDQGGGVDELRLYNNSKLISSRKYTESKPRSGKQYQESFEIPLVTGENKITAIALDKSRTESSPVELNVVYDGIESDINLYILAVGINKYENPSYELSYAINDAKAYLKMVEKGGENIFQTVEKYFIKDGEADKDGIKKSFMAISKEAGPEDVFIFYFAGHGAMSAVSNDESSAFYIIPYDVTQMYGNNDLLMEKGISANEILELSKSIAARKQMFILDACQSGGALTAFNARGASREKAIAQLARSTGTFFLLASGAIQYASEAKDLGHGIFTYAILEALGGKADGGSMDEKITANEIKSYVEGRVPELTRQYMLTPQYPTGYAYGQDFPVVIVK